MSEAFVRVCSEAEIENESCRPFEVRNQPLLICKTGGNLFVVQNLCTHAYSPLHEGRMRHGAITCPLHSARFNLATGACMGGAGYAPLRTFASRIVDGWIEIELPEGQG